MVLKGGHIPSYVAFFGTEGVCTILEGNLHLLLVDISGVFIKRISLSVTVKQHRTHHACSRPRAGYGRLESPLISPLLHLTVVGAHCLENLAVSHDGGDEAKPTPIRFTSCAGEAVWSLASQERLQW